MTHGLYSYYMSILCWCRTSQVIRLGSRHLYWLSHFISPTTITLVCKECLQRLTGHASLAAVSRIFLVTSLDCIKKPHAALELHYKAAAHMNSRL